MKSYKRWILLATVALLMAISLLPTSQANRGSAGKADNKKSRPSRDSKALADLPERLTRITKPAKGERLPKVEEDHDLDGTDPDLPPRLKGRVDESEYLRMRDAHISLLRGFDVNAPLVDPTLRVQAIEKLEAQQVEVQKLKSGYSSLLLATPWLEIGPASPPLPNGQTQQFPATAPVTGRATAIVVDPTNSNKVYLGAAQGGVWRSLDGGASWTAIFDTAQSLSVGALALAPSDPTKLYVGTGEPNNSADSFFGVGVYRIDNADTTADLVGPINPLITTGSGAGAITTNCFTGRAISQILVHPTDPATIFVSTAAAVSGAAGNALTNTVPPLGLRGVYRSTNATAAAASVTFAKLIVNTDGSLDSGPATGNTSIFDMILEPGNPNNLLVTTSGTTLGGAVYRSTNALAATPTFTQTLFPGFNGLVMKLAINKVAAVVTVYVASNEPSGVAACSTQSGRLRKSTNGGVTWSTPLTAAEGYCGGQCFYDNPVGVDPNDANIVYLGGNARGTCSDVLKRSSNGGTTFTRDDTGLHADSHAFAFDPLTSPTTVWFVNDGGVWKRQDAAAGTPWLNENNSALGTIQFVGMAVHPTDANFTIGGTQDNGTESQLLSGAWTSAESGDGGFALIDQSATGTTNVTMYHTFFNQTNNFIGFDRTNLGACLAVKDSWEFRGGGFANDPTPSCDGTAFTASNGINVADTVLFYAPMALGPGGAGNPNTLYFGTNKLYRSTNRGDTMSIVSQNPLIAGVAVSAIGISPTNDNVRIVGMRNGNVFATTTGSSTLTNTAFPFPTNATASTTNRHIGRAVIDPANSNTAYVTLSYYTNPATAGNVWRTTNLSAATPTWTSIGNTGTGLPNIPVNGFAVDANDPTNPGVSVLYAGTDIGVYASSDGGASWAPFGTGLPRVSVFDMAIQPTSRILRVATHGRGMWEIQLPTAAPTPTPVIVADGSTLVNESCPPTNGAIDPGETATVNLKLMNSGTGPTTNLVATLLPNANVLASSGPQTYGAIAPGATVGRDFTFTAAGNCGDTITLTLQLQDGATSLGTASYTFILGCNTACAGAPRISTSTVLSCSGSNTVATITICDSGTATANNVVLTTAKLGGVNGTPLPQTVGTLAPGACATVTVTFSGAPSGATTLQVGGTFSGGTYNSNRRVNAPACNVARLSPAAPFMSLPALLAVAVPSSCETELPMFRSPRA